MPVDREVKTEFQLFKDGPYVPKPLREKFVRRFAGNVSDAYTAAIALLMAFPETESVAQWNGYHLMPDTAAAQTRKQVLAMIIPQNQNEMAERLAALERKLGENGTHKKK